MNFKNLIKNRQDRLLAFFDAILAIAITMIALEIDIPEIGTLDAAARYDFFVVFTCYLISFVAMGTLWYIHTNFFSNHELTGNGAEIILHLVLLFVITLFQPITRAVGQYPQDVWVRVLYIVIFLLMYGLGTAIFILVKIGEDKKQERSNSMRQFYLDAKRKNGELQGSEWNQALNIAYAVRNPEDMLKLAKDKLPDEYADMIEDMKKQRERIFRISVISTLSMAAAISIAVICLVFNIWLCYLALILGVVAVILVRYVLMKSSE